PTMASFIFFSPASFIAVRLTKARAMPARLRPLPCSVLHHPSPRRALRPCVPLPDFARALLILVHPATRRRKTPWHGTCKMRGSYCVLSKACNAKNVILDSRPYAHPSCRILLFRPEFHGVGIARTAGAADLVRPGAQCGAEGIDGGDAALGRRPAAYR